MRKILLFIFLASCGHVYADGGRLRFSKVSGPFLVTLFTTPEPLTPGAADFSVMIQDAKSGAILSDASIAIDVRRDAADEPELHAIATHAHAVNKLLQAADLDIPSSGTWLVHLTVQQGTRTATIDQALTVSAGSRETTLVWVFGSLPLLAILLFALHQRQKEQVKRHATTARNVSSA